MPFHNEFFYENFWISFIISLKFVGMAPMGPMDYMPALVQYSDVIMGMIASQITSLTIVYSTVYSDADQRKHQSSVSLAFVRGIHRGPVNSSHKWPVVREIFPFDDVIMWDNCLDLEYDLLICSWKGSGSQMFFISFVNVRMRKWHHEKLPLLKQHMSIYTDLMWYSIWIDNKVIEFADNFTSRAPRWCQTISKYSADVFLMSISDLHKFFKIDAQNWKCPIKSSEI